MKISYILALIVLLYGCADKKPNNNQKSNQIKAYEIVTPEFQTIIDSANVRGSILFYDLEEDRYYSNDFRWAKEGRLPASTFKIVNSIIALETGVVENDSTLFKWNGEKRRLKNWEQDLLFKEAFQYSCVPCYQEIARNIGLKRMVEYLKKLDYGDMTVDSTNIDLFWLEGDSRVSQFQQVDFLKRFYRSELPISERTEAIMKRVMELEVNNNYVLSGKTGFSSNDDNNNGWFVGYIESNNNVYFFATNIESNPQFDFNLFLTTRKEVTLKAFEKLKKLVGLE